MCRSKEKGGLGICSLSSLNRALLGKWNWHFVLEANSAWRRFIKLKYETESGGWYTNCTRGNYGVGLWKDIRKEASQMQHNSSFKLGNGSKIHFWEDLGAVRPPLCNVYPSLYNTADLKGAFVADLWDENSWNLDS